MHGSTKIAEQTDILEIRNIKVERDAPDECRCRYGIKTILIVQPTRVGVIPAIVTVAFAEIAIGEHLVSHHVVGIQVFFQFFDIKELRRHVGVDNLDLGVCKHRAHLLK